MTSQLESLRIFVIPGWTFKNIAKNKLDIIDIANYSKLRKVLSIDDLAEFSYVNDLPVSGINLSTDGTYSLFNPNGMTEAESVEYKNSILPLSGTLEIAGNANARLKAVNYIAEVDYRFIRADNILYVILNEGFLSKVSDNNFLLEFVKGYLKECYKVASIVDVSKLAIFSLYTKLLVATQSKSEG